MSNSPSSSCLLAVVKMEEQTVATLSLLKRKILRQLRSDHACVDTADRAADESAPLTKGSGHAHEE